MEEKRLDSVDAFRGFSIVSMILIHVQYVCENRYHLFTMSEWNGISFADLIMPFFLFISGVSVVLSHSRYSFSKNPSIALFLRVVRRVVLLFLIGIGVNVITNLALQEKGIRVMGVLQRLALVYLACVLLFWFTKWKHQILIAVIILVSYWALLTIIPVPGEDANVMEPGKGWTAWIDSRLLPGTLSHETWDAEGLVSTVSSLVTGISGMLAGYLLISKLTQEQKIIGLFLGGFITLILGQMWHLFLPYNKALWTGSYVLYTSGWASMLLASLTWLLDSKGYRRWTAACVIFGRQAIVAYVFHFLFLLVCLIPLHTGNSILGLSLVGLERILAPKPATLVLSIGVVLVCYGIVLMLHLKRIYLKL